jgi:hypothetical protein
MTCLYAPVSSLLAGCISLGEEKALGLTASQFALPFSRWLQWLLKLAVCAGTAVLISLGLPVVLFLVTGGRALHESGLMNPNDNGIWALACISGLMFLLSYWAITLAANTLRAALVAIVGSIGLPAIAVLGIYCGTLAVSTGAWVGPRDHEIGLIWRDTAVSGAVLMLAQSLARFRANEEGRDKLFFYSFTLGALVLFTAFWATCFG